MTDVAIGADEIHYTPSGLNYRKQNGELCATCKTRSWTYYRADDDSLLDVPAGMRRPCNHLVAEHASRANAMDRRPVHQVRDITEPKTYRSIADDLHSAFDEELPV